MISGVKVDLRVIRAAGDLWGKKSGPLAQNYSMYIIYIYCMFACARVKGGQHSQLLANQVFVTTVGDH